MTLRIPSSSTEYLHIPVTASVATSGFPVQVAVIPPGNDPIVDDWVTAGWDGTEVVVLIGPAQPIALTGHSTYVVWVKVDAGLEIPVIRSGVLITD